MKNETEEKIEKKIYSQPLISEFGQIISITQGNGNSKCDSDSNAGNNLGQGNC